jgi:arabinofuranosyltransferase
MKHSRKSEALEKTLAGHYRLLLISSLVVALVVAWQLRFVQDDAFVSFTFAKSLVEGNGLTWFGNRVEGYTNFLWVTWIALGMKLGIEPIAWSYAGGLASLVGCVWCLWEISRRVFKEHLPMLLAVLFFIGNFSVLSYATGGLETMLQTFLLSLSFLLACLITADEEIKGSSCILLSLVVAAAVLARLDSAVIVSLIVLNVLISIASKESPFKNSLALLLPAAIILLGWFAWRWSFYGKLLPNTYYAKVGWDERSFSNGILYLGRFLHWYLLWPIILLGLAGMVRRRRKLDRPMRLSLFIIAAWFVYVVAVGGDFMEFRFIIPVAPFLFLWLAYLVHHHIAGALVENEIVVATIAAVVLTAASIHHGLSFNSLTEDKTLDSIEMLSTFYGVYPDHDFRRIGRRMKEELGATGATISTSAVGSIPFYGGLRTVDGIGLCDENVSDPGSFWQAPGYRPGHLYRVNMSYLKRQGVNFVLDQPTAVVRGALNRPESAGALARWILHAAHRDHPPDSIETVVAMPLDARTSLLMLYLTPTAELDSVVRSGSWEVARVRLY